MVGRVEGLARHRRLHGVHGAYADAGGMWTCGRLAGPHATGLAAPREQPANAGRKIVSSTCVVEKCTSCHSLERVTQQARTPAA